MSSSENFISVQVLSALAWADGEVTSTEQTRVVEFISNATSTGAKQVREVLACTKELSPTTVDGLGEMSLRSLARLLEYGYAMANEERAVTDVEMALLRSVCNAGLDASSWDEVQEWLAAQHRATALFGKHFGG